MKKGIVLMISVVMLFLMSFPVFAETADEAAERILSDTSEYLRLQHDLHDDVTLTVKQAGELRQLAIRDVLISGSLEEFSDLCSDNPGYVYLVYADKTLLTAMYLERNPEIGWVLLSMTENADDYLEAVKDYQEKTGEKPVLIYSPFACVLYNGGEDGYLRDDKGQYFELEKVFERQLEGFNEMKDMVDEQGRYKGELRGGYTDSILGTDYLEPIVPVKEAEGGWYLLILPVILLVGVLAAVCIIRKRKQK